MRFVLEVDMSYVREEYSDPTFADCLHGDTDYYPIKTENVKSAIDKAKEKISEIHRKYGQEREFALKAILHQPVWQTKFIPENPAIEAKPAIPARPARPTQPAHFKESKVS